MAGDDVENDENAPPPPSPPPIRILPPVRSHIFKIIVMKNAHFTIFLLNKKMVRYTFLPNNRIMVTKTINNQLTETRETAPRSSNIEFLHDAIQMLFGDCGICETLVVAATRENLCSFRLIRDPRRVHELAVTYLDTQDVQLQEEFWRMFDPSYLEKIIIDRGNLSFLNSDAAKCCKHVTISVMRTNLKHLLKLEGKGVCIEQSNNFSPVEIINFLKELAEVKKTNYQCFFDDYPTDKINEFEKLTDDLKFEKQVHDGKTVITINGKFKNLKVKCISAEKVLEVTVGERAQLF